MRLVDADKLFPDVMKVDGSMAISQGQLARAHTVEAIPKDQYEVRLKADMVAMLTDIQLEIHKLENPYPHDYDNLLPLAQHNAFYDAKSTIEDLVEQKIDKLKEQTDDSN